MDFSLVCLILQVILVLLHFHILYLNTKRNARYEQLRKESDKCFDTWAKERSSWEKRARQILLEIEKNQKSGHWINNHNGTFECSNCGCKHSNSNYCPNCGCDMREGIKNDDNN